MYETGPRVAMSARPGSHRFYHRRAESINRHGPVKVTLDPSRLVLANAFLWRRRRQAWKRCGHRQLEVLRRKRRLWRRASLQHDIGGVALIAVGGLGNQRIAIAMAQLRGGIDIGEAAHFLEALLVTYRQVGDIGERSIALRAHQAEAPPLFPPLPPPPFHP